MNDCKRKSESAFTLIETIVVVMLSAMVLVAVLGIYNRVRASAVTIIDRLQQNRLQTEILQKIAEDIDRLAAPGFDATINFQNKLNNGYHSARLILENSYYGTDEKTKSDKKDTFERVEWVTDYDMDTDTLKLYRMHTGLNAEDKLLGQTSDSASNKEQYIPVADGVTLFEVKAQQGETVLGAWTSETLPKAVRVGLSFAPHQELADGSIGVPDEQVFYRTIAIDRTRRIPYQFVKKKFDLPEEDPNALSQDPNGLPKLFDENTEMPIDNEN
ncbi:MAG: type II secretion system GspH family protein [Phycisphaerae bacterium]|nr:type II secretion system GspH family protein [Phycisphaerae bacterium]